MPIWQKPIMTYANNVYIRHKPISQKTNANHWNLPSLLGENQLISTHFNLLQCSAPSTHATRQSHRMVLLFEHQEYICSLSTFELFWTPKWAKIFDKESWKKMFNHQTHFGTSYQKNQYKKYILHSVKFCNTTLALPFWHSRPILWIRDPGSGWLQWGLVIIIFTDGLWKSMRESNT